MAELRARGAKKIAIAGHSQGGSAALYYATQRQVDGIVLIAPGGYSQGSGFQKNYAASVAQAHRQVEQGRPNAPISFTDLNTGDRTRGLSAPAQSVVDYFDPEGPMNSFKNAARLEPGTAVLLVSPTRESEALKRMSNLTHEKLSSDSKPSRLEVNADHLQAPDAAKEPISEWLKRL